MFENRLKPFNSLAVKLSLVSSLLVLSVIGLMAERILSHTREGFITEMRVRAEFFAKACADAMLPKIDSFQLHYRMEEMMQQKGVVYAEVVDAAGKILSYPDKNRIGDIDNSPEAVKALESSSPYLVQSFDDLQKQQRYYDISVPISLRGHRLGTVRLGFTNESLQAALWNDKKRILLIAVLATMLAVFGTVLIVGWIMRPLPLLARAAQEIGQGNLKARVEWKSTDEIGVLAGTFNEMANENARAFAMLTEEKEKLNTVFSETRDGLLWADAAGGILLMNPTARQLLGFVDRNPVTLQEAFEGFESNPPMEGIIRTELRSLSCEFKRKVPKSLILAGTCEHLATNGSMATGGLLMVLRDVTMERKEELLSRSVLSLISHKLRTPLTVTLGYQQLLEQGEEGARMSEFQKKSLYQMRSQMEKLRYLVERLLIFATVQNPETIPLETALCLPKEIVERVLRGLQPLLTEGKVQLEYDAEVLKYLPAVMADARHLTEALKNLTENAVKFNATAKAGHKKVKIEVAKTDDSKTGDSYVRFSVTDNGPGIPPEEHGKLFRKFYQIDEYFTGQIEGMGLGLAYVKNVAQAHRGKVGLRSEVGKGSTFYFDIPCIVS